MNKDEALKMAIETMKIWNGKSVKTNTASFRIDFEGAINACKEALAQPAQEPVAFQVHYGELCYLSKDDDQSYDMWCPVTESYKPPFKNGTNFYTHPAPSWQGLSDDEINDIKTKAIMGANGMSVEQLLRFIVSLNEQALRIKNDSQS